MFVLLLASTLLVQPPASTPPDTSGYSTPALKALIAEAAELNRRVPPGLGGYRAMLESEISIGNHRTEGNEMSVSLEQVASRLRWDRTGEYDQQVTGYRSQAIGVQFASLGFFRSGWAIPSLYGNRIALLFDRSGRRSPRRAERAEPLQAVHPLAADRDLAYRFSGGDTILTMKVGDRSIPIVRITVEVRDGLPARTVVFLGELDLDASRRHLVRMRGHFAVVGGPKPKFDLIRNVGLQGIAYVEAVNSEVEGSYWLPRYQRFEAQATAPAFGEGRAIFRILTRFTQVDLLPPPAGVQVGSLADSLAPKRFRLAIAPPETLSLFTQWRRNLGEATADVSSDDFLDLAPARWRPTGPPIRSLEVERLSDVLRVDRVQGIFTGVGGAMRFRDRAPGVTLRAAGGYAWSERTVRGRVALEQRRGNTRLEIRAGRSLDLTNDFRNPFDSGSTLNAIFGSDDYDYVDRRSAGLSVANFLGARRRGQLRLESGYVEDRAPTVHLEQSPLGFGDPFRANRVVRAGNGWRNAFTLEWRPDVSLEFLRTGVGARFYVERLEGDLASTRVEGRVTARLNRGPLALGARFDVGATNADAPPQQFFELGSNQNLPGYDYKEFAGNQAAVLRGMAAWRLPYLAAPIRLSRRFWLPSPSPTIALGLQSGWTASSDATAEATVRALGSVDVRHPRATTSLTLRFFGGALGVGIARPLDHPEGWRALIEFGQQP